jgi:hypothetical protein
MIHIGGPPSSWLDNSLGVQAQVWLCLDTVTVMMTLVVVNVLTRH